MGKLTCGLVQMGLKGDTSDNIPGVPGIGDKTAAQLLQEYGDLEGVLGNIDKIWGESDAYPNYEGRTGASPREIKVLLLNAAQHGKFACVSPLAVFTKPESERTPRM